MYSWGGFNDLALPRLEHALTGRSLDAAGITLVENAVSSDPKCRAHIQLLIGEEWERVGDRDRAKTAYTKAVDCSDPEYATRAKEALDQNEPRSQVSG